jgi:hypothetical protein
LAAYAAHGYEPPTDFSRWSRFLAAGTARRGTRTIRLAGETANGLRAARGWRADASKNNAIEEADRLHSENELRRMRRAVGVFAVLTASTTVGAHFTKGAFRVVLVVLSGLFVIVGTWVALWASLLGSIDNPSGSAQEPWVAPHG